MATEETPLLKAIEKMRDDYLESGFIPWYDLPNSSDEEKRFGDKFSQVQRRISSERIHDYFTGLWSRAAIWRLFDTALAFVKTSHQSCCIALFDIDNMKLLNDMYGGPNGDGVLLKTSEFMKMRFHPVHWVSRFGGDAFLIIFNCDLPQARNFIEELQETLNSVTVADEWSGKGLDIKFTFKIGLTALKKGDTKESCLQRLEIAIHNVRNQLVIV